jgi:hypothetical protein
VHGRPLPLPSLGVAYHPIYMTLALVMFLFISPFFFIYFFKGKFIILQQYRQKNWPKFIRRYLFCHVESTA